MIPLVFLIATLRLFIVPRLTNIPTWELSYEALAHMIVGFLIGVAWYDKKQTVGPSKLYSKLGWGLATFELLMFLGQYIMKFGFDSLWHKLL
jgi:hypothetical protein